MKVVKKITALLALLLASAWVQAQNPWHRTGTVDDIDVRANTIVISDVSYQLPEYVPIHRGRSVIHRERLKTGKNVGYSIRGEGGGRVGQITEMWILPDRMPASTE